MPPSPPTPPDAPGTGDDLPRRPAVSSVVVSVLTYRRPEDLPQVLPMLVAHCREAAAERGLRAEVLVVDNDAAASAREVVHELGADLEAELDPQVKQIPVRYVVEPTPGIAAARNRALEESTGVDVLVFVDDDERPEPGWLVNLLAVHASTGAALVAGAVLPDVGRLEDGWLREGGFFDRARHPTGTQLPVASTANLLVDMRQLAELGNIRFDPEFGLSGGSDTMFTAQVTGGGGRLVWCDEAVVIDHIRTSRLNRHWVLQRHFRAGNGWARIRVKLSGSPVRRVLTRLQLTAHGGARVLVGGLRSSLGTVVGSRRHQARGSRTTARGVGMLTGAWGVRYVEYHRKNAGVSAP